MTRDGENDTPTTRRQFLQRSAVVSAGALIAACGAPGPSQPASPRPAASPGAPSAPDPRSPSAPSQSASVPTATSTTTAPPAATEPVAPSPSASPTPTRAAATATRVLYREAALADGRSADLRLPVSVLVEGGRITWIRPSDAEGAVRDRGGVEVVDASGATIVPGMVDCHSHITLPGGARWIDRGQDPPETLLATAEANARLMMNAGVRWARDVGAPRGVDPEDGRERALSLGPRDRWRGKPGYPHVRAAGTWITPAGGLPGGMRIEVRNADELLAAALAQLDEGADFVKLYLQGRDRDATPWSAAEIRRVVEAVRGRGAKVTAHATNIRAARAGAEAGVDSLEHGYELDRDLARLMAQRGVALVSTLTVLHSQLTFGRTTRMELFASPTSRRLIGERLEAAESGVRLARDAGVRICAGTDFGGGSGRANQLAWEVESLVRAGLEPWQALGAATWRGGELLGEPEAGVVREGGPSDFFLVHGDPLSDPAALWRVWRVAY